MRRDEPAPRVENAEPVGVSVLRDGEVQALLDDAGRGRAEVRGDRLRMHSAEERVALGAEGHDARSSAEDVRYEGAGGPVHRVGEDREARRPDRVDVNRRGEPFAVRGQEVRRSRCGPGGRRKGREPLQRRVDRRIELRRRAAAEVRLDLESVVGRRVVARRDRDAAREPEAAHVVRHRGRRDRIGRSAGRRCLPAPAHRRRGGRTPARRIACRARRRPRRVARAEGPVDGGRRCGDVLDRGERAALGDDAAPPVRPEGEAQRGAGARPRQAPPAARRSTPRGRGTRRRGRTGNRGPPGRREAGIRDATGSSRSLPRWRRTMPPFSARSTRASTTRAEVR